MTSNLWKTQDSYSPARLSIISPGGHHPASTIVIGLGNPILGDDGVGWRIAERIQELIADQPTYSHVVVECLSLGGLSLMEHLVGYDCAILIDAISLRRAGPGTLYIFELNELPDLSAGHLTAAHDTSLQTALDVGRAMGAPLPTEIQVIGVESVRLFDFSEELTPPVAAAVPEAVNIIIRLLEDGNRSQKPEELRS